MAATLQRKFSGGTNFVIITKTITKENVPRNYFVIISAGMVQKKVCVDFRALKKSSRRLVLDSFLGVGRNLGRLFRRLFFGLFLLAPLFC